MNRYYFNAKQTFVVNHINAGRKIKEEYNNYVFVIFFFYKRKFK